MHCFSHLWKYVKMTGQCQLSYGSLLSTKDFTRSDFILIWCFLSASFHQMLPKTEWPIDLNWCLWNFWFATGDYRLFWFTILKGEMVGCLFSYQITNKKSSKYQFWLIGHLVFGLPWWNEAGICLEIAELFCFFTYCINIVAISSP